MLNIYLTKYLFPLPVHIDLSKKFGFIMKNPSNEDELNWIKKQIEFSFNIFAKVHLTQLTYPLMDNEQFKSLEQTLLNFKNNYSENTEVMDFFSKFDNDVFTEIARLMIIVESSTNNKYKKNFKSEIDEDIDHLVSGKWDIFSYSSLISLLVHSALDDYPGDSFLIHKENNYALIPEFDLKLCFTLYEFSLFVSKRKQNMGVSSWRFFPLVKDEIIKIANKLDSITDDAMLEKLLYVANMLKIAETTDDKKIQFFILISILELMLSHNSSLVEESITKQLILKISVLLKNRNKNENLEFHKKKIKDFYSIRSNIAHGNFAALAKSFKKMDKTLPVELEFDYYISLIYYYIRIIIEEYIEDSKYIDYLKEN